MFEELTPTEAQKILSEVNSFIYESNVSIQNMIDSHTARFNQIWFNPNATAKQMFEGLGSQGKKAFTDSYAMQMLIKQLKPDYQFLVPPLKYSINQETGVVTIIEPVVTEQVVETPESENPSA